MTFLCPWKFQPAFVSTKLVDLLLNFLISIHMKFYPLIEIIHSPPTPKLTLSGEESSINFLFSAKTSIGGPFSTPSKMLSMVLYCPGRIALKMQ